MKPLVNRRFVIAVLTIACLTTVLLVVAPIRSSTLGPVYNPWLDINNDDRIDIRDVSAVAKAFGAQGAPGQNVTKASIQYESGWIDITDKCGQNITITHDLNSTDLIVDIQGKTSPSSEPHQRNYGLSGYMQGWNKTYTGTGTDGACALVQTSDRGYALAGYTGFGGGWEDFWLVKTDFSGSMQWNRTYGGTGDDYAYALVQTSDGGYALAGRGFANLVKTDASGNMQWNQTYGGGGGAAYALVQTADGGYALAGVTDSFGAGGYDAWLVKTDSAGNALWNMTYGGTNTDAAAALVQTSDGGYALAGNTESFGAGSGDFWLVKTDASGNAQWNMTYGGTNNDMARALVKTSDGEYEGGYALAGSTDSFGAGNADFWLVKTDSSGNMMWNQTYGGTGDDGACALVQTSDGGYALAGYTHFGLGAADAWLVKIDAAGRMMWNKTYGGTKSEWARALVQTADGGYALGGGRYIYFAGNEDFWLVKTDTDGNVGGVESGLAWVGSSANTITLYRGATDTYWNYVRVRLWKPR